MLARRNRGAGRNFDALIMAPSILLLSLALVSCAPTTARMMPGGSTVTSPPIASSWKPPADPHAKGPTQAPALESVGGALDEKLRLPTEMSVQLTSIKTTTVKPQTPGETAGPAVIVSVAVKNMSDAVQNVDSAVVMLVTDDGDVGIGTTAGPDVPLRGDLKPGEVAEGSYVFMLDPAKGRAVTISVNYGAGEPIALFTGRVP